MKVFLISVLRFLLFTVLFYIIFICTCGRLFPAFLRPNIPKTGDASGFTNVRLDEADTTKNIDILFLGSSRAYRSFDNRIFSSSGFNTFNLGTSNQTPIQSFYLLKKYIVNFQPKIVIFEVNPDIFSGDGTESAVDLISNTKADMDLLYMAISSKNIKALNSFIFSTSRRLLYDKLPEKENNIKNNLIYIKGGFVQTLDSIYQKNYGNSYNCHLDNNQLTVFEKMMSFLKGNGITTILVQTPVVQKLYESCAENERFDSIMNKYEYYFNFNLEHVQSKFKSENESQEFISPNKNTDTIFFSDGQHMNQKGVLLFNQMILQLLYNVR